MNKYKIKDAIRNYQNKADRITMAKGGTRVKPLNIDVTIKVNAYIDFDNPVNRADDKKIDSVNTGHSNAVWVTLDDPNYDIRDNVVWYPIKTSDNYYFPYSYGIKNIIRALIDNHGLDVKTFGIADTRHMLKGICTDDTR